MKISRNWYRPLIKKVNLSATEEIRRLFPTSRFVVINQKRYPNQIVREIAFVLGPFILCTAKNVTTVNDIVDEWLGSSAEKPLGQLIQEKGFKLKKKLVSQGKNYRKYAYAGAINSTIIERFFDIDELKVGAYCGNVLNKKSDEKKAYKFTKKNPCNFYLFPEAYPFSRRKIDKRFPPGTIFGRYGESGPEMYFSSSEGLVRIHKSTLFANEKTLNKKVIRPTILHKDGIKVAALVCYDLLNPGVSYAISKRKVDLILISAMIPSKDLDKWASFVYARGTENQCTVILCSGRDKRRITNQLIIHYDPTSEKVKVYKSPQILDFHAGERLLDSPKVHWSILLKNKIYGPFVGDY